MRFLLILWLLWPVTGWTSAPHFRHPHYHPAKRERLPFKPRWVSVVKKGGIFKYKRQEFSSPILFQDRIFLGGDAGVFYAMTRGSGRKIWRFKTEGSVNSQAATDGAAVFFGDDKGILYALSFDTGTLLWKAPLGSEILTAPVLEGDRLFAATVEGRVVAVLAKNGEVLWDHRQPSRPLQMTIRGNSPPTLDGRGHLCVGFSDGTFRSLRTRDGQVAWEKDFQTEEGFSDIDGAPLVDGDRLYMALFDGPVISLSSQSGKVLWRRDDIGSGATMAIDQKALYVSGSRGRLFALNTKDGSTIWETKFEEGALTAPIVHGELLAVGLSKSTMNFVDRETGRIRIRRFARKGISSNPILAEGELYYFSNGGRLYSLRMVSP